MMQKIAFVLYPVTDMKRARKFYEQDLGLVESANWDDQWVEYSIGDDVIALTDQFEGVRPASDAGGCVALEVDDVDTLVTRLRERGARVTVEPMSSSVCRMATVLDPEGNALILHHVTD